ncbi:metallophosphoesterase [Thermosipho sp. (in: thermotogales)]|uniref:metallophosphoesterase family protein n=1 Tax=Thermosipho sp. (in: thermotogales) TaxID=1968895 RepID=UPI00257F20FB|nr:metallophosphoesterase [Thermosipho sp. (in: thermotogales)]MBZ4649264.1 sbcD [Thermosipho sp. (in: thermotogales)]
MLISSDPHYGTKSEIPNLNKLIDDVQLKIINYAIKTNQDYYINLGDIFDNEKPDPESIAQVTKWVMMLEENQIESYLLLGNHDGKSLIHSLSFIKEMNLEYVKVIDEPTVIEKDKYRFIFIPHVNKQLAMKHVSTIVKKTKKNKKYKSVEIEDEFIRNFCKFTLNNITDNKLNLVFCHLNVDGAVIGPNNNTYKANKLNVPMLFRKSDKIKYIFCGHIHSSQVIKNKDEVPIIIPGSIQRRRFDEIGDNKYFIEVDLDEI